MSRVRIELGRTPILSRVYIDDIEVRGVSRVWFDSGDFNSHDGPRRFYSDHTRVHLDILPDSLVVEGDPDVTVDEVARRRVVES